MKTYKGHRPGENDFVADTTVWSEENGVTKNILPDESLKVRNHSPTGFNWGYGGSGPTQLALALLLDCSPTKEGAERYYQDFKNEFVSRWGDNWEIKEIEILVWLLRKGNDEIKQYIKETGFNL